MKNFSCPRCRSRLYFESTTCLKCDQPLGFDARTFTMVALDGPELTTSSREKPTDAPRVPLKYCANAVHGVCNWLTPVDDLTLLCAACDLNRTIPNLSEDGNLAAWHDLERAKKRLIFTLLRLGLPLDSGPNNPNRLTFDFARNTMTGHMNGVITIDVTEADTVERERQRQFFGEPYRSLLGHLRHESGHFYWMLLIDAGGRGEQFRTMFGDEREDYQAALAAHHGGQVPSDWQERHVSAYSSAHPWEDWAETWAHYLHMLDAVDTAEAEGMEPRAAGFSLGSIWPFKKYDLYRDGSFETLLERWMPLTIAMNNLSRSMGHTDFYPFVITPAVAAKLGFVHRVVRDSGRIK
jgi:hypothetical protein